MGKCFSRPSKLLQNPSSYKWLSVDSENELEYKRPDAEVECITNDVEAMVKKILTLVGISDPRFEISHQYLVGSMAEGTRIGEPDEFDFLVVLKHFSEPDAIRVIRELEDVRVYDNGILQQFTENAFLKQSARKKEIVLDKMYWFTAIQHIVK